MPPHKEYVQLSPIEIRVMKDTIEEHMGAFCTYPLHIQKMLITKHLTFAERFSLTLFVLQNGLPPQLFVEWLIGRGMLHDWQARMDVASIISGHQTGKLENTGKTAYSMYATTLDGVELASGARVQPVYTPNFARTWQHCHYWTSAISTLLDPKINSATILTKWRK